MKETKICTKCLLPKILDDFPNSKAYKTLGKNARCKKCINDHAKAYRESNKEKVKASRKSHYQKNKDKLNQDRKKYTEKHKDKKKEYDLVYREENKEKISEYKKNWTKEKSKDPVQKIKKNMRRRLHHVLKGNLKADKTFALIGCSAVELKSYLESLFQEGMTWDNYSTFGWHVNHIKPCHAFNLLDSGQQKECFHYSNLRPLWWRDNLTRPRFKPLPDSLKSFDVLETPV